jgi:hypothetical protein
MSHSLVLSGLDGGNPLAFLAAIGTLAVLDRSVRVSTPRMDWVLQSGAWRPRTYVGSQTNDQFIDGLGVALEESEALTKRVWEANRKLPYAAQEFRALIVQVLAETTADTRLGVDLLAALGVDALSNKDGSFLDTALRMVRSADSAGNGMSAYAAWIIENTTREQLCQIFAAGAPTRGEGRSLRWDPAEHRARALQWGDPSKEPVLSCLGFNRLALEALPVFTTVPVGTRSATVGFSDLPDRQGLAFTWPIWGVPLSLSVVRSLLTLSTLTLAAPDARTLALRGIVTVYRSVRFASSKYYSNFTPAIPV